MMKMIDLVNQNKEFLMKNQANEVKVGDTASPVCSQAHPSHFVRQTQKTFDSYHFGGYDWLVLDIDAEVKKALLLSKYVLETRSYHGVFEEVTWETSDIRNYLNGEFYDSFAEADKARIVETRVVNNNNPWLGTTAGNKTTDKVFLLSLEEVVKYLGDSGQLANRDHPDNKKWGFSDSYNEMRITTNTIGQKYWWWLRSPGYDNNYTTCVESDGLVSVNGSCVYYDDGGVRPAMWINLESGIRSGKPAPVETKEEILAQGYKLAEYELIANLDPAKNAHGNTIKYFKTLDDALQYAKNEFTCDWWKDLKIRAIYEKYDNRYLYRKTETVYQSVLPL